MLALGDMEGLTGSGRRFTIRGSGLRDLVGSPRRDTACAVVRSGGVSCGPSGMVLSLPEPAGAWLEVADLGEASADLTRLRKAVCRDAP